MFWDSTASGTIQRRCLETYERWSSTTSWQMTPSRSRNTFIQTPVEMPLPCSWEEPDCQRLRLSLSNNQEKLQAVLYWMYLVRWDMVDATFWTALRYIPDVIMSNHVAKSCRLCYLKQRHLLACILWTIMVTCREEFSLQILCSRFESSKCFLLWTTRVSLHLYSKFPILV